MSSREAARASRDMLLDELRAAGAAIRGTVIKCPFHDDTNPSGGVYETDGVWKFKCHACGFGGDIFDVRAEAENKPIGDVLPKNTCFTPPPEKKHTVYKSIDDIKSKLNGNCEAVYTYTNPETKLPDLVVFRFNKNGKKSFWQASPAEGGFVLTTPSGKRPLYNRIRVSRSNRIIVVEGEKCVHALNDIGFVATTSPGGANSAKQADWSPLAGKEVYLWPDNDKNGIGYMQDVFTIAEKLDPPPTIKRLDPATLGMSEKADAVDYLDTLGEITQDEKRACIENLLLDSESTGASSEVGQLLEDTISGKRRTFDLPWSGLTYCTKALYPGTVTTICGDPGSGKSFWFLQAFLELQKHHKIAMYELEEDRAYHLHRALAILDCNSNLTDDGWIRDNPDEARAAYERHKETLDIFGRAMHVAPTDQITLTDLTQWVQNCAQNGVEIVGIDPITAAAANDKPWAADLKFVCEIKKIAKDTGIRVLLVTHPKKGRKGAVGLDELAGGTAYGRFPQCILWVERYMPPRKFEVKTSLGPDEVEADRLVKVIKARNARGVGLGLAYHFDPATLQFCEYGIITKEIKK